MTGDRNPDGDDDLDDLDEAFDALVTELEHDARAETVTRPSFALPAAFRAPGTADDAALLSMLPARGMTQPGWDATSPQPPRAPVSHAYQTPSDGTTTASTHGAAIYCPTCKGAVDVRSRHVAVHDGAVRVYCSAACLAQRDALPPEAETITVPLPLAPKKSRRLGWALALLIPVGVGSYFVARTFSEDRLVPPAPAIATTAVVEADMKGADDPMREADAKLVDELSRDAWIHPLAGPKRRMPRNHSGAFGASRPGERPPECVSGHCGVDLGYVWGEPVYAVHEGVVDFVQRGPNEDSGGAFVRIAHRGGTLFSWYFHLAGIPKTVRAGTKIKAGDLIGVVGDTGIKHSEPHLHFSLSVKTSKHVHERYLDPEPLIAIWPLWIPNEENKGGRVSMTEEPGIPQRGSHPGRKRAKKRAESAPAPSTADAASATDGSQGSSN
jgi:murein DD-endopeptidase MepM/ murein hydrolase activator NlpD